MNDEEWAIVITLADAKAQSAVNSTLRFASRKLAFRAHGKFSQAIRAKGVKGLTVLGPIQLTGSAY